MTDEIIDLYTHFMPSGHLERYREMAHERGMAKRIEAIPLLHDFGARIALVRRWPGYRQVLAPCPPGLERMGERHHRPALARLINEGLAEICQRHGELFPAFVAALPMDDVDAALRELDHAASVLGARGVQLFTNVGGRALDAPEFAPVLEAVAERGLAVFLHPARGASFADYASETESQYEIWQVLGWPYETAACVARLIFSGVMDRHPDLKLVTHHLGGIIPYLEGRIGPLWDQLGSRTEGGRYDDVLRSLRGRPIDYFRRVYADTATGGSAGALRCGLDFFGSDRLLFASDCPFDPEGGPGFIRDGLRALEALGLGDADRSKIQAGNAHALLRLS